MKYIIGHKKPDLDASVAPLALAYFYQNSNEFPHTDCIPVISEPANQETQTIFAKFNATIPALLKEVKAEDEVILVDHNETSQRDDRIADDQIIEVVDHHKVSINLSKPISFTVRPWGSSATIIAFMMKTFDVTPDQTLASLMVSAILSDTVGLKSATTTQKDKDMLQWLNQTAGIKDLDELTLEIFKAKSNIGDLTPEQIVTNDYKVFDFGGNKVLINQVETVEQDKVLGQKADLIKAMEAVKEKEALDFIFCAVTDVLKVNTKMIYLTDQGGAVLAKAFDTKAENNVADIGAKMSRKKEFAPGVEKALAA